MKHRPGIVAALLLATGSALVPAQAATTCSVTQTDLQFGAVVPTSPASVDVTATLSYTCRTVASGSVLATPYTRLAICFGFGPGVESGTRFTPREMTSGSSRMQFQLYKDAGRTQPWGTRNDSAGYGALQVRHNYAAALLATSATLNASLTVYGRVFGNQPTLTAGSYVDNFTTAQTRFDFATRERAGAYSTVEPASCVDPVNFSSGNGNWTFKATASVSGNCNPDFATQAIDFGNHSSTATAIDATTTLNPNCTNGTTYQIGLDNGRNANGSQRRMRTASGEMIGYELYRDAGRSQRWGGTAGSDTRGGTGNGSTQNLDVYARVPAQATQPSGTYSDTVTATITY